MNAIVKAPPAQASSPLMPSDMRSAMDLANMMATAKLVPTHLQGKPGDCLLVIEQAMRWGMSPFAVAQATSVISGKLMFEGKLVSAALNASGILSNRMAYDFDGEGASRAVAATATIRGEASPRTIRCTLAEARTTNGMWQKQPDQQLVYFATRAWARRHAPEVMLGVYSPEEFDVPDTFRGTTVDANGVRWTEVTAEDLRAKKVPSKEAAHEPAAQRSPDLPRVSEPAPPPAEPKRTFRQVIDETAGMLTACDTMDAVAAIADLPQVRTAIEKGSVKVQNEMKALLADAFERVRAIADDTAEAEEPFPGDTPLEHAEAMTNSA